MVEATDTPPRSMDLSKTAILAGSGRLPELLAHALRNAGTPPLCVSIDGEAGSWINEFDHKTLKSVEVGMLVRVLKAKGVKQVVLAGGIRARPSLWSIRFDWVTLSNLRRFHKALGKGDDRLLRSIIEMLERQGFKVIGAHEILPGLVAPKGVLTRRRPDGADMEDRELALGAALSNGANDMGQAAVAIAGKIVAVEDARGTDDMLSRVKDMGSALNLAARGVLAKAAKPRQEHRADLPSIGPETVDNAVSARLAGIVVSAGSALILDREEVIKRADAAGIFVEGCDMDARK
jgi:UDP-2,3-diacylglucosamine hydrolase